MSNTHDDITGRLSAYIDGELTAAERAAVDEHVAGCEACRTVLGDLRKIVGAAARLPDALPDTELWNGVAQRIGADARTRVTPFQARAAQRFSFTVPQLAAAGIVLMLMSGGLVYMMRPPDTRSDAIVTAETGGADLTGVMPVSMADAQYDGAVADLERTLEEGRARLDPETVRVLEQNLDTIDKAIDQCRRALETDPANSFLSSHLVSARQRKLALLRRATALTTGS